MTGNIRIRLDKTVYSEYLQISEVEMTGNISSRLDNTVYSGHLHLSDVEMTGNISNGLENTVYSGHLHISEVDMTGNKRQVCSGLLHISEVEITGNRFVQGIYTFLKKKLLLILELVFVKHYAPNCLTLTLLDSNTACT